jgi:tetratricopeptide (TPR) repeat protein
VPAWYELGVVMAGLGEHDKAVASFLEGLRLQPDDAVAWYALGRSQAALGNRGKLVESIRRLRSLDPSLADRLERETG